MSRDRVAVVDQARLVGSARVRDGFYSTFVVRKISRHATRAALRLGLRPNEVTLLSLLVGLIAAGLFARGEWTTTVVAAVALQVSLVIDCADGEVARYTGLFSPVGAWLDGVGDRLKEYSVYAGLAAGYHSWGLAATLLVIQVFRHHIDFGFAAVRSDSEATSDGLALGARAVQLSERTNERPALMWAKRVVIMPIGERWLLISVISVIGGGRAALATLVVTCSAAALYTTLGRLLRALAKQHSPLDPQQLAFMTALLPPPLERLPAAITDRRLAGGLPGLVRGAELAVMLAVAARQSSDVLPVAFALATVIALDGYDVVYRLRQEQAGPARWRRVAVLGAALRLTFAITMLLALDTHAGVALGVLACWLASVCVVEAFTWLRTSGSAP